SDVWPSDLVAHSIDSFARDALPHKISIRVLGGGKQKIGDPVRKYPVDLLRHGSVEGTEAGFHMANPDQQFGTNQSCSQGGVHISIDQHQVGCATEDDRLEPVHDVCRLP